jgi:hypothetical protein
MSNLNTAKPPQNPNLAISRIKILKDGLGNFAIPRLARIERHAGRFVQENAPGCRE